MMLTTMAIVTGNNLDDDGDGAMGDNDDVDGDGATDNDIDDNCDKQ